MVHLTLMSYPIRTIFQTQGSEQGERKRHCCHSIHTVCNKPTSFTRYRSTSQHFHSASMHATTRARRREIWDRERRARERRMGSRAGEAGEGVERGSGGGIWAREVTPPLPHFAALALPLKEAETRGGVYLRHHAEERKNGRPLRHGDAAQKERERLQRRRGISASASFPHESASTLSPLGNPGQFHLVLCFSCSYYTTVIQTSY